MLYHHVFLCNMSHMGTPQCVILGQFLANQAIAGAIDGSRAPPPYPKKRPANLKNCRPPGQFVVIPPRAVAVMARLEQKRG